MALWRTLACFLVAVAASDGATYDYADAIKKSILFYQAQRSGRLSGMDSLVSWRKDSCLTDQGWNGEDLTQGYFDAGDYVKFTFPLSFALTMLSWGAIEYEQGYTQAGAMDGVRDTIKWGTDWLLKAHTGPNEIYLQVGNGTADHAYWGRPEDINFARPAYRLDTERPGSDCAGEAAAALASASIVFSSVDATYSATLLNAAKELIAFADNYRGRSVDSVPDTAEFYASSSYDDELVWGYTWLYKATNDQTYLQRVYALIQEFNLQFVSSLSWDQKTIGTFALLADMTGNQEYKTQLEYHCWHMAKEQQRTPKGLLVIGDWGNMRLVANVLFTCLQAAKLNINADVNKQMVQEQMGYILGDTGYSYVVGFGSNYPHSPHHRSSSCPDAPATCDWNFYNSAEPNAHVLYGALMGGPDANDAFTDTRTDWAHTEPTLDYNAGFQGVLAAMIQLGL
ncbi:uncharacterized protein LOC126210530 [Schistocerca nitens]|uniref:uncharacterized protein LOC126210530 n=1 Tax=Schistocerca nitens TaxID=7011 RepID=UPI0021198BB2|nr:uncharacterized protein LOC126210530 [Schistocerca nitens]